MNPCRGTRCWILLAVALPAAALDRPPESIVGAGSLTCAQYRKAFDDYKGVVRREQPDVVKILESSIQYANFEGTLGGFLARAQMERSIGANPIASPDEAMGDVYRSCEKTPNARYIEAVARYVEDLASGRPAAPAPATPAAVRAATAPAMTAAIAPGHAPPGSPIPIHLDAAAVKTWEVVRCEAGYSSMYCTLRNTGAVAVLARNFASKAVTADGIAVGTRPVLAYETVRPGESIRVDFAIGAGSYKAVLMEIHAR
jgi:hypothetical protein